MTPSALYARHCRDHNLAADPSQHNCLLHFDRLWHEIETDRRTMPAWRKLFRKKPPPPVTGIYLWGGVGRGKSMLMDIFYASLTIKNKQRHHFHHFMLQIHQSLKKTRGTRDPLTGIARDFAQHTRLLCLDEFHVNDIADAMLLYGLLDALLAEGVILVTTSNYEPGTLYKEGLQRARFLPAIELIRKRTEIVKLTGQIDYRLQTLRKDGTWHFPLSNSSEQLMRKVFEILGSHTRWVENSINIGGRTIPVLGQAEGTVWFDFKTLCDSPRSQNDYIEIACQNHTVLLSGLPVMHDSHNDAARRLLNLLDILYDHRVKLVVTAATSINEIYCGERLTFEFERATSRLIEMQSESYLVQTHRLQQ
jgi:cell division protein ZapE